jgi:hypothetical protein
MAEKRASIERIIRRRGLPAAMLQIPHDPGSRTVLIPIDRVRPVFNRVPADDRSDDQKNKPHDDSDDPATMATALRPARIDWRTAFRATRARDADQDIVALVAVRFGTNPWARTPENHPKSAQSQNCCRADSDDRELGEWFRHSHTISGSDAGIDPIELAQHLQCALEGGTPSAAEPTCAPAPNFGGPPSPPTTATAPWHCGPARRPGPGQPR